MIGAAIPLIVIGGLAYAAIFIKPAGKGGSVELPTIERRDIFYGVAAPVPKVLWAAGQYGKIVRSANGGESWVRQPTGTEAHLQAIAAWDGDKAVAVGNALTILVTGNAGAAWRKVVAPEGLPPAKLLRARAYDGGVAWAVGEFGTVLASIDHGATWRSISTGEDVTWNDIAFVGPHGWMVGEFGRIRITSDGGATWTAITGPTKSSLNAVGFRDERNGVAVGTGGAVLITSDGGATWTHIKGVTEQHIFDVLWDGSRWLLAGDKGLLLTAGPDAQVWADASGGGAASWHSQIDGRDGRYVLGGYGITTMNLTANGQADGAKK